MVERKNQTKAKAAGIIFVFSMFGAAALGKGYVDTYQEYETHPSNQSIKILESTGESIGFAKSILQNLSFFQDIEGELRVSANFWVDEAVKNLGKPVLGEMEEQQVEELTEIKKEISSTTGNSSMLISKLGVTENVIYDAKERYENDPRTADLANRKNLFLWGTVADAMIGIGALLARKKFKTK